MDAAAEPAEEPPKKKKKKAKVENGEAAGAAVAALAAAPALNGDAGDAVVKKKKKEKAAEGGETPVGKKAKAADGEKVCDESVHVCLHELTLCVLLGMLCCAGFQQLPVLRHARLSCHCMCTDVLMLLLTLLPGRAGEEEEEGGRGIRALHRFVLFSPDGVRAGARCVPGFSVSLFYCPVCPVCCLPHQDWVVVRSFCDLIIRWGSYFHYASHAELVKFTLHANS